MRGWKSVYVHGGEADVNRRNAIRFAIDSLRHATELILLPAQTYTLIVPTPDIVSSPRVMIDRTLNCAIIKENAATACFLASDVH